MYYYYCWRVKSLGAGGKVDNYLVWAPTIDLALCKAYRNCLHGYKVTDVTLCDRKIFVHNNFD